MNRQEKPDYANWIPAKLLTASGAAGGMLAVLFLLSVLLPGGACFLVVLRVLLAAAALLLISSFSYLSHARRLLSYEGGGVPSFKKATRQSSIFQTHSLMRRSAILFSMRCAASQISARSSGNLCGC